MLEAKHVAGEAANAWDEANPGKVSSLEPTSHGWEVWADGICRFIVRRRLGNKFEISLPLKSHAEVTETVSESFAIAVARMVR